MAIDYYAKLDLIEERIEEKKNKKSRYHKKYNKQYSQANRNEKIALHHEHHQRAIEMLGGQCMATGATEKLEFCHRVPSGKLFDPACNLNSLNFFDNQKNLDELRKCSLLCNAAHKAYDKTFTSLGYPQNEETFPIWLDSYRTWYSLHKGRMTYREYLIKNPIMEITE